MDFQVVILAGGFSSNLQPLVSKEVRKALLPVANRPVLSYVLDLLESSNLKDLLVTTIERRGLSGVIDQTRGLLYYVEVNCAKAVYTPELRYACIAGRYIRGAPLVDKADENVDSDATVGIDDGEVFSELAIANNKTGDSTGPTFRARFVGQVCGRTDVWGDGVVPEVSAYLEGALNVSFDGVYHSSSFGSDDGTRPWYGSPIIVNDWIHHLLE